MKMVLTTTMVAFGVMELGLAQEPAAATTDQRLNRRIEVIDQTPLFVREALVQALRGAHLPGGIELSHCGTSESTVTIDQGTSVKTALERVRSVRPQFTLDPSSKEVLNILDTQVFDLLETRIPNLTITNPSHGTASIREIVSTPEVLSRLMELKLREADSQIGFSAIPKPGTSREAVIPLKLADVTVREALNVIAAASGRGVWVYEERGCSANEGRSFGLTFAVQ